MRDDERYLAADFEHPLDAIRALRRQPVLPRRMRVVLALLGVAGMLAMVIAAMLVGL